MLSVETLRDMIHVPRRARGVDLGGEVTRDDDRDVMFAHAEIPRWWWEAMRQQDAPEHRWPGYPGVPR